jgi:hypothetical protein
MGREASVSTSGRGEWEYFRVRHPRPIIDRANTVGKSIQPTNALVHGSQKPGNRPNWKK